MNKKTKIICTLGPSSGNYETLNKLVDSGMNIARINFSHGNHIENGEKIDLVQKLIKEGRNIAVLLDTKGPEIRVGMIENNAVQLEKGDSLIISMAEILGNKKEISVSYPGLYDDVDIDTIMRVDDGKLGLKVVDKTKDRKLVCEILNSHILKNRKSVGIPFKILNMDFISEKDKDDLIFGCQKGVDFVAASFTRRKQDMLDMRKFLDDNGGKNIKIIAKIENQEGFDNLNEILDVADGIMVARGDLGVEVSFEEVPVMQKHIIKICQERDKIVIVATQMLESMTNSPVPTRAEVSDVANAVYSKVDAVMLSGETANGQYPIEACSMQASIARRIEKELSDNLNVDAKLVICVTENGALPAKLSSYRLNCPIIALTKDDQIIRSLCLNYGVYGQHILKNISKDELEEVARNIAINNGLSSGDIIAIACNENDDSDLLQFITL